jgi:hypothetical protein
MSTELLAIILGTGGVAMLGALVQAWRSIRAGAAQHERDAYSDLEQSRRREYHRRERAEIERDYWHAWAAMLEFVIRTKLPPEDLPLRPPWPKESALEES